MDLNTSILSIMGLADGTLLILSQATTLVLIAVAVVAVSLLIGLLLGLLIGRTRTPKAAAAPVVSTAAPQSADEDEIVAVIAATVLAMESARTGTQLVLRGITHVGTEGTPWSAAGRKNLMK